MRLTKVEKLILVMLCELHEKLGINKDIDPAFVKEAIYSDNVWALEFEYQGLLGDDSGKDEELVDEVGRILDMWWFMEMGYAKLSDHERKDLESTGLPYCKKVEFRGFDGNNELEHLSVARFYIDQMGRFTHFRGRDLNSHAPSLEMHRRMLAVFPAVRSTLSDGPMKLDKLKSLLEAARYN